MKKMTPAASPDAYVEALNGWRRKIVKGLRSAVLPSPALEETVKWGHLVYLATIEPRLKAGGKYEMATLELREGMTIPTATVRRLVREAVSLDRKLGDPGDAVRPKGKRA